MNREGWNGRKNSWQLTKSQAAQVPSDAMQGCSLMNLEVSPHHYCPIGIAIVFHHSNIIEALSCTSPNSNSSVFEGQAEPWRTGWTVKDSDPWLVCEEHPGPLCLVHARWRPMQAKQAARLACVKQCRTAGRLERRFTSWRWLRIVWSLTLTLLAVNSYVLKALAVAVPSLWDVSTTKRSCCLVAARWRRELCSELKQSARALHFCFVLSNAALSVRHLGNIAIISWFFLFFLLFFSTFLHDVDDTEYL